MRSTDFNTPSLKLILMALLVAVGLHVVTAVALMNVKTSTPTVEPIQTSSPIEIQLLTLPPVQVENSKPESPRSSETIKEDSQAKSEPAPVEDSKQKEDLQAIDEPNQEVPNQEEPEQVAASEEVENFEPIEEFTQVQDSEQAEDINQVQDSKPDENLDSASKTNTSTVERAATTVTTVTTVIKKSDSEAGSGSKVTESSPVYDNTYTSHSTNPSTPNTMVTGVLGNNSEGGNRRGGAKPPTIESTAQTPKDISAVKNAAGLAAQKDFSQEGRETDTTKEEKAAQQKVTAQSKESVMNDSAVNDPVATFDTRDAEWVSTPKFHFSDKAKFGLESKQTRTVLLSLMVKRDGRIESVNREQPSGNTVFDREAMQQIKKYQLQPFMKNDVAVRGKVIIPVEYEAP
ncbi:energy transducer TonB [Psychrobacter fulvigenes]|uniref:energy transducer TonB n=1 Tax=Psychrobacter fulvigenes TaxID=533323 RepID=UPI00191B3EB7|nr:energy transducer TonB [Psychrobacter fulvigenes]